MVFGGIPWDTVGKGVVCTKWVFLGVVSVTVCEWVVERGVGGGVWGMGYLAGKSLVVAHCIRRVG